MSNVIVERNTGPARVASLVQAQSRARIECADLLACSGCCVFGKFRIAAVASVSLRRYGGNLYQHITRQPRHLDSCTYDVDEAIHHYHRAARELWKFCWSGGGGSHTEIIAHVLDRMATDGESISWWDRVAPLQRD